MSPKKPPETPQAPFNNPFGALTDRRERLPAGPSRTSSGPRPSPARAVVRLERKGRGGKEVTVVEQLALPERELERWLKELKAALGCGGAIEDGGLLLQGDQRERIKPLLEQRGVRRVSIG
jgi:translation initiation factor 1